MGIYFKLAGAICIMGATGYFAVSMNQTMELRKQELRKLYSLLIQLKSEIQYMYNPLPESFAKLAKSAKEPFSTWLFDMVNTLEEKEEITFSDVWKEGVENLHKHSALEKEDVEPLKELADKLGSEDVSSQLKAIDYAVLHLEGNRTVLEKDLGQKKKVTVTLSLFCGAMTLILLL
ncbi:MAG: stage III sporulation protein AB [Lachnospiraceae bacterium]|nr:stage III sporulation protein AB [Lachnospiraceae bacterium]